MFYPPDPAGMDLSSIGGNAATGAGGPACVKYGTTKDYILGLEAVLADGTIVHTGTQTRKGVVGYDLTKLLVGSEGTLAVITGLWIKLIPRPQAVASLGVVFPSMDSAMRAVTAIMSRGFLPSAIEFMDHKCLGLVKELLPFSVPGPLSSFLLIELDGAQTQIEKDIVLAGEISKEFGATDLLPALAAEDRERIWKVRRQISLEIRKAHKIYLPEDVAVPTCRIADLVAALPRYEEQFGLTIYAFGHAGDGNIHFCISAPDGASQAILDAGLEAIMGEVLAMGGTVSAEHGIGEAKRKFVPMEIPRVILEKQIEIKKLFDPNLILNPGKIF